MMRINSSCHFVSAASFSGAYVVENGLKFTEPPGDIGVIVSDLATVRVHFGPIVHNLLRFYKPRLFFAGKLTVLKKGLG